MRLAYLSTDRGIAFGATKGASVHVAEIAKALAQEGHDVLVLVHSIVADAAAPAGVTVEPLAAHRTRGPLGHAIEGDTELDAWVTRRVARFGAEALYERLALHSATGAAVARSLRIPHLVELNAPLLEEAARYRVLDEPEAAARLEAATLRSADIVLAVSPPLAEYAAARSARRVEVLQNAADLTRFPRADRGPGEPVAVFAGSLRPWHGIDTIARAWRRLGTAAPPLLVVGDGPERGLLAGLEVDFAGAVAPAEVPALLARADIGLAPYGRDTPRYFSPLKLFEYLAAGLAPVVADMPAVREIVDADSAILIPPGDEVALAAAVANLCADPERRLALGSRGRALIESRHTWRHRARRVVELAGELAPLEPVA